jgi:hypothetical protein
MTISPRRESAIWQEAVTVKLEPLTESGKPRYSLVEHLFLRHGAGSDVFKPIIESRWFNVVSWILIVLGVIGWMFFVWFLHTHFPE